MKIQLSIVNSQQHVGLKERKKTHTLFISAREKKPALVVNAKGDEMSPCFQNYIHMQHSHTHTHVREMKKNTIRTMIPYAYSM